MITNEDIQQAIKEGFANGYSMAKAKYERPQGKWIITNSKHSNLAYCSECNFFNDRNGWDYCPNCGAEMRGGRQ